LPEVAGRSHSPGEPSDRSKALIQIINDHLGLIHPGGLPILFDAQARHLDLAALLQQGLAILFVVLRVRNATGTFRRRRVRRVFTQNGQAWN
jgi:hypothetical protein